MPIKPRCCNPFCCFSAAKKRPDPISAGAQTAPSESGPGVSHDVADVSGVPGCDKVPPSGSSNVSRRCNPFCCFSAVEKRPDPTSAGAQTAPSESGPGVSHDVADVSGVPGCDKAPPSGSSNVSLKSEGEDVDARLNVEKRPVTTSAGAAPSESGPFSQAPPGASHDEAPSKCDKASTSGSSDLPNRRDHRCINEAPSCSSSSGATKSRSDLISSIRKDIVEVEDVNIDDLMSHISELLKLREEGKQQQASNIRKFPWPNVPGLQKLKEIVSFGTDLKKLQNMLSAALKFGSELKDIIHEHVTAVLKDIGKVSVASAGLLVVAHTLETLDDAFTNNKKCWDLIKEMSYVASIVKRLKESPQGMAQFVIPKATSLLVEGAIMCCNEIGGSAWKKLLLSSKIKGDLSDIRQKLHAMYLQINTEIGFRLLSAVEREGRSPLSKGYPTHAVGIDEPIKEVLDLLEIESDQKAVTVILHGFGGTGKTTLGDAVFSEVGGCKYSKVRLFNDINSTPVIIELQKQILKDLVEPGETIPEIRMPEDGQRELERVLANVDAFICIDNVLKAPELRMLLPHDITKAKKVRLLLTARDDGVKISCSGTIPKIYKMNGMQHEEAMLILKTKIKEGINDSQFNDIIEACGGIPLMLTLAASFIGVDDNKQEAYSRLMGQKEKWTGDEFEEMRCVFAYDAIPPECKDPFLDVCTYFNGWEWDIVQDIVGKDELRMLESRALVTKATNGVASVHDVILTLARQKSVEESNGEEVRLRFTSPRELEKFLEEEDTQGIKGIWLARHYDDALHICASRLDSMHNSLRVLHLETPTKVEGNCNKIFKELIYLKANIIQLPFHVSQLKQLRYLSCEFPGTPPILQLVNFDGSWQSRAFQVLSADFIQLRNLRVLIFINFTKLKELPKELGKLVSLRVLKLIACESIRKLPEGLVQLKNLKELVLNRCRNVTELCNDFSSQILDLSECDRLEQFPGDGSCPSTDISVQDNKENMKNRVLSELDRLLINGRGQRVHLSDLPPNTSALLIFDFDPDEYNFPWPLIEETVDDGMQIKIIYIGPHFDQLPTKVKDTIFVLHTSENRLEDIFRNMMLTAEGDVKGASYYLQMDAKMVGDGNSDNYAPCFCWRFLKADETEEFMVCNSGRYLRLKKLQAEGDEESSNIEMLRELFAPNGDETIPVFEKKDSSWQVTTCGVDQLKGKTILLDLRSPDSFDDIGLPSLREMYDVVVKQKLDLEIISIPILRQTDAHIPRDKFYHRGLHHMAKAHFLSKVPWFVFRSGTRAITKVAEFFLTKQCGWEEGDECEKWYASLNCIIEPNGRVIPFRPFTKYTEAKSTPILESLFHQLERVSDQVKRIMFQVKWGVKACPTVHVHEEIENFKKEEWEQLKRMSTLEFLFNHLESTSDQVQKLMRQRKIICLYSGHQGLCELMNEMDQFKKGIQIITVGDTRTRSLLLTDTIYKNYYYNPMTIPTDVEKMSSLNLSSQTHEPMRFSLRLHYLKEEINRIKESDKKLSELKSVLHSFQDEDYRFMTFMDQYGKVVATLGANNIDLIFGQSKRPGTQIVIKSMTKDIEGGGKDIEGGGKEMHDKDPGVSDRHRAQLFIKSMMEDIEGGGKEMHDKDPGVSDSLIQNMQTASTSVAVEQKDMDAYFESLLEYISELWGVELHHLFKFNKDGKKSSPSRVTWPASRGFCMLENFLSKGTDANWVKDVISRHPEEVMCKTVIKSLLNDIGEENWDVAGLRAVAHVLERFDSVSANRIEWLFVLDQMLTVAQYIKQLNQKPELSWKRIKRVATVSIVICSIACSAVIDPSKFAKFELETVDKHWLTRIQSELKAIISRFNANAITFYITREHVYNFENICQAFDLFFETSW